MGEGLHPTLPLRCVAHVHVPTLKGGTVVAEQTRVHVLIYLVVVVCPSSSSCCSSYGTAATAVVVSTVEAGVHVVVVDAFANMIVINTIANISRRGGHHVRTASCSSSSSSENCLGEVMLQPRFVYVWV